MNMAIMERDAERLALTKQRLERFRASAASARTDAECRLVRKEAVDLLQDEVIAIGEYAALFGGQACHVLTRSSDGRFQSAAGSGDADAVVRVYSRAKHGSTPDIERLVQAMVADLLIRLDDPATSLHAAFEQAKANGDHVVLFGTGLRNVPAASNVMCEMFAEEANMGLVGRGYPTIANVRLPRIAPPCDNYAQLSLEERVHVSLVQDHVLPDANFYRDNGVHVLFADDVIVTGATADKVYASAITHGARSFHAIYPVLMDPVVALREPEVEEALNTCAVGASIDDGLLDILASPGQVPVLRTLRLVFSQQNHHCFPSLMQRLGRDRVRKLYRMALSADFNRHGKYAQSLAAARVYLGARP
jgi:hypothetical protein